MTVELSELERANMDVTALIVAVNGYRAVKGTELELELETELYEIADRVVPGEDIYAQMVELMALTHVLKTADWHPDGEAGVRLVFPSAVEARVFVWDLFQLRSKVGNEKGG